MLIGMPCTQHLQAFLRQLDLLSDVVRDLHPTGPRKASTVGQATYQLACVDNARTEMYRCLECWTAYHQLIGDSDSVTRPLQVGGKD